MAGMATSFNVSSASSILSRPSQLSSLSFSSKPFFLPMRSSARTPLRLRCPRIMAFSSNDIKVGSNIEVDGAPWRVIEFLHVKPGKGAAFVRTKMRNYISGNTVEKTFRAGSTINEANIYKETKQFTYKDGPQFVFMDLTTYEETRVNESSIGDKTKWLKEGMDCNLLLWNDRVLSLFSFKQSIFSQAIKFPLFAAKFIMHMINCAQDGSFYPRIIVPDGALGHYPKNTEQSLEQCFDSH